ncbi:ABC transporter permease [Mobilicoccus caccae]|uniref:Transport permease protein n=1 Tax=Mobilicoccus caccae TaxID=1859295 RepID=A0ABQ6IL66_9MICO|nr:ABC transporter permease [Mobilicoccus caccae]GMA38645.1 transport permease protein [Mobilicoccus caccae]
MSAVTTPHGDDAPIYHRYEPHKAGMPPLRTYLRELWRRREFAVETSKANMRAANTRTFFGQAWLIINPLLLALVYYILVDVLRGRAGEPFDASFFAHLTAGLFVFYFFQGAVNTGASSVTGAGKVILNTAMPRLLLPIAAVRTGFYRFLPTVPVYFIFHILAGNPWTLATFVVAPIFLLLLTIFATGLAALFAALQVYFRDAASFLPYVMRIWLYSSPVLWTIDQLPAALAPFAAFNPLYALVGGYNEALQQGIFPAPEIWLLALAWAFGALVLGCVYFLMRERDFAVRL